MPWAAIIAKYKLPLFYGMATTALLLLIAGFLLEMPAIGLVSFGMVGALLLIYDFRILFYLLLFTLPLSDELVLGSGISLFLPTDPLAIVLLMVALLFGLMHPKLLKGPFWKHPITLLLIAHLVWIGFASITSTQPVVSLKYIMAKLWFMVTFYFLATYLLSGYSTIKKIIWLLFLPTMGGIIYVLIRHGMTGFLFDTINPVVRPIFRNHVNYGVWITAILPLMLLARSWFKTGTLLRLFFNISILVTLAAIYFSYTRGAWVALFCLPIFIAVIRWRLTASALLVSTSGILLFIALLFSGNTYLHYAPDFHKTIYHEDFSDHMAATFQMQDMSTVERFYRWIAAVKMAGDKPWSGFGPGNFVNNYKSYTVSSYETYISDNEEGSSVHNYFLTLLTEQGIPGLVLFAVLIFTVLMTIQRLYHRQTTDEYRHLVLAIACCFMVLLVNNFFSDLLEADKLGPLFFLCLAILVRIDLGEKPPVVIDPPASSSAK